MNTVRDVPRQGRGAGRKRLGIYFRREENVLELDSGNSGTQLYKYNKTYLF